MKAVELKQNSLAIFTYGSKVYGTANEKSDTDYICVIPDNFDAPEKICEDNCDYNIFHLSEWNERKSNMLVDYLECRFLPDILTIKNVLPEDYTIDFNKVRDSFSREASNSFVKCKKKLTIEKDFAPYIGKKSLWHSLRIIMFGIQIMKYGRILDYTEANSLYDDIVNNASNDWQYYKDKYQPIYNQLKTQFRLEHANRTGV